MSGKGLIAIGSTLMAKLGNRRRPEPEWQYAEPGTKTSNEFGRSVLGDETTEKLKAAELEAALSAPRSVSAIKIDSINFPILEIDDEWKVIKYEKIIKDFVRDFKRGHFSVCIVHEIINMMGSSTSDAPVVYQYYERLSLLHCVDFKQMTDNVKIELVDTLNACFRAIEDHFKPRGRAVERFVNRGNVYDAEYE